MKKYRTAKKNTTFFKTLALSIGARCVDHVSH